MVTVKSDSESHRNAALQSIERALEEFGFKGEAEVEEFTRHDGAICFDIKVDGEILRQCYLPKTHR